MYRIRAKGFSRQFGLEDKSMRLLVGDKANSTPCCQTTFPNGEIASIYTFLYRKVYSLLVYSSNNLNKNILKYKCCID